MGKPQQGPSVSYETYRNYVKNQHQKWKKETQKPKEVAARNFAAEQVRKDAEAMDKGCFTRQVFKPNTSGERSDGL